MLYMVTFTINIPPMLAYIPYMDPMGCIIHVYTKSGQSRMVYPKTHQFCWVFRHVP